MNRNNLYLKGNKFAVGNPANKTSFKKGQVPWNTGLVGICRPNKSSFKKGQKGINWVPTGTRSRRKDPNDVMRNWIKIKEPNVWIEYSHFLWKKAGKKQKRDGACIM